MTDFAGIHAGAYLLHLMLLGLTGGIATGKSTMAAELLRMRPPWVFFDADRCVHDLLAKDSAVGAEIRETFGDSAMRPETGVDRKALGAMVFADAAARKALEGILHPRVRARWQHLATRCRAEGQDFLADIPLLFETGAEAHFDATVVVAASEEVQRRRLADRGISDETAVAMLRSQWPLASKIEQATFVAWNDGTRDNLSTQSALLVESLFG